ncbi:hypothetical protein BH24ACT6_BH24ACT6_06400 [soil metagenome]
MDPQAFAGRVAAPDVVTISVHTPNEGSIAGTDLTIPFDEVASSTELPDDRSTRLAVYCRSGNMSADAIDDLEALGYTDIAELEGVFDAGELPVALSSPPPDPSDDDVDGALAPGGRGVGAHDTPR